MAGALPCSHLGRRHRRTRPRSSTDRAGMAHYGDRAVPERRDEGQNVDIRGAARDVILRMGIDGDVRAANTGEIGTASSPPTRTPPPRSRWRAPATAHRDLDSCAASCPGSSSNALLTAPNTGSAPSSSMSPSTGPRDRHAGRRDRARRRRARHRRGLHSRSRRFVSSARVQSLGMYFAYATLPRRDTDDRWWRQHATTLVQLPDNRHHQGHPVLPVRCGGRGPSR